ncbi:cobalamin biosynthesis protein [Sphingobium sufflavum]|uniref:cobalamin biosynthesis protein n=1 Tax=Sphingobium sufflavum TaxID=1129547 RepID=UPI001F48D55D|nr:cobalamin biosynthesis protein [Sphingobium sufflavum]MCE7797115.1 cobalamin biosynthesis protein [Sphingobium sufflavum]
MSRIVAGFGFRSGAAQASLADALQAAQAGHPAVSALAAPADKAVHVASLAETLGLPLIAVEAAALEGVATSTRSAASLAARNTGSVAEAVALAAAGPGARLLTTRHIAPDRMATCALAQAAAQPSAQGTQS